MLVLTRKLDQEIVIGDNIRITVLKTKGNTVRLGIDAPRDVSIMRGELETFKDGADAASDVPTGNFTIVFGRDDQEIQSRAGAVSPPAVTQPAVTQHNDAIKSSARWHNQASRNEQRPVAIAQSSRDTTASEHAIHFRGELPKTLQRNRLQEIAARISNDTSKPR